MAAAGGGAAVTGAGEAGEEGDTGTHTTGADTTDGAGGGAGGGGGAQQDPGRQGADGSSSAGTAAPAAAEATRGEAAAETGAGTGAEPGTKAGKTAMASEASTKIVDGGKDGETGKDPVKAAEAAKKKAEKAGRKDEASTGGKKKDGEEKGEGEEEEEEEEEKPFHFDGEHEYQGVMYPASVPIDVLKRIRDFKFRPDDVVVAGYPKCGATWVEHATYLLLHAEKGEAARTMHDLTQHAGFLEVRVPGGNVPVFMEVAEAMEGPRIIRTHLPYHLLKEQLAEARPKVLVALRNPKDCIVSYYHFLKNNEDIFGFYGDFDKFFEIVKEKRLTFGDWFDHVLGWWSAMHDSDHVLFLEYEDMVRDLRLEIQNIVDFLEIDVEEDALEEITRLCQFKEMAKNPMTQLRIFPFLDADVKRYMRKGEVGNWKEHFSDEQNEYIDEAWQQRVKGTALELNFGDK